MVKISNPLVHQVKLVYRNLSNFTLSKETQLSSLHISGYYSDLAEGTRLLGLVHASFFPPIKYRKRFFFHYKKISLLNLEQFVR